MRTEQIKREMRNLKRTVDRAPRVWRFRGRRVVHAEEWKYADWSKFPDTYSILIMVNPKSAPADWYRDYIALMVKLEDPLYGRMRCSTCTIHEAQRVKEEIEWYQFDEPPIIDPTDFQDIERAIDDDRITKIAQEHLRYMKETGREIWNL